MKRTVTVLVVLLALAAPAHAARFADLTPYLVMGAGQTADAWSTRRAQAAGCVEANPLLGTGSPTRVLVQKVTIAAGIVTLAEVLRHQGHSQAARVIGYTMGVSGGVATLINLRCAAGSGR